MKRIKFLKHQKYEAEDWIRESELAVFKKKEL